MAPRTKKSLTTTELKIERSLYLSPEDWTRVVGRESAPLEKPVAQPFDSVNPMLREREQAHAKLTKIARSFYVTWQWPDADIAISLTKAEAHFWLTAMTQGSYENNVEDFLKQILSQQFTGDISVSDFYDQLFCQLSLTEVSGMIVDRLTPEICLPLFNLFSQEEFTNLLFGRQQPSEKLQVKDNWKLSRVSVELQSNLVTGFGKYILPYQTDAEIRFLQEELEQSFDILSWPQNYSDKLPPLFYLAAYLGDRRLLELVENWADDRYAHSIWEVEWHSPQSIVMGLGNVELIKLHMERLQLPVEDVRSWLAHTRFSAIDYVGKTILNTTNKSKREGLLKDLLASVQAPEIAPIMLKLSLASESGQIARKWFQEYPGNAIAGLIAIAASTGTLADAALEFLHAMKRRGHQAFIEQCLQQEPVEIVEVIRSKVLTDRAKGYIAFDDQSTPDWLRNALELVKPLKKRSWVIDPCELPAISIGNQQLSDAQVSLFLDALEQSTLAAPHPLVAELKDRVDRLVLDNFAWKLSETWLGGGGPPQGKWTLRAIGLIGSDPSAIKLAPLIRLWPQQSQHARTTLGLECLRAIGTTIALVQINDIAQNLKYSRLKTRAQECMQAIAKSRGITVEQLADRIIPNYGLDDRGQRIFDFGPRRFQLLIDGALNPIIQDTQGKQMSNLPRRNNKDNVEQADQAIADWKLIKKQIGDALKKHSPRLESAMVQGRTWHWGEFESLLIQHPLMTHLAQRLVWATFDDRGILQTTFRVAEDWTCADRDEHHYSPDANATIGIVHPLWLDDTTKFMWIEVMGENHIIQPFPQLSREIYELTADEANQQEIKRFQDVQIPCNFLAKMMKTYGWSRGRMGDRGEYYFHHKYFKQAGITAMIGKYDNMYSGQDPAEKAAMTGCLFIQGQSPDLLEYPLYAANLSLREQILQLREVDRMIISEVLRDMSAIVAGRL
jgi:Domain of unknown function (DUF4132)